MAALFHIVAGLALLAALIAWAVAVRGGLKAIAANRAAGQGGGAGSYALLAFWPFAVQRRGHEAEIDAVRTGKAAIAFFVCVTIAVAAISAYTNLTFKHSVAPAGSSPAAPAGAPSKS
ncbi:hypothetical protein V5F34_16345 [Xanthobacter autotrophicus]|jgi:hypothetical protein|uniref:Uncharacterized protein n=1 Tax=Xanthobacter autotrophicus TaxID=280 RepID=A0A6C1KNQ4_XANAU|nr:hypothetical protein [Xanthobacter autotrophicus]TLX44974.1 hypothetical protein FBQ73_00655 [Xanthobacter autotrophicus]